MEATYTFRTRDGHKVSMKLTLTDDNVFSASGSITKKGHKKPYISGQCLDKLEFQDNYLSRCVVDMWKKYNLNDMHDGTVEQEAYLEKYKKENDLEHLGHHQICDILSEANLLVVDYNGKPFKYGSEWLKRDIPADDLRVLKHLISYINTEK